MGKRRDRKKAGLSHPTTPVWTTTATPAARLSQPLSGPGGSDAAEDRERGNEKRKKKVYFGGDVVYFPFTFLLKSSLSFYFSIEIVLFYVGFCPCFCFLGGDLSTLRPIKKVQYRDHNMDDFGGG